MLKPSKPLVNLVTERLLRKHEGLFIFILSLLLNLGLAYFLYFVWQIGSGDAIARTANAFYVLYSREPHLAAVGFVWPPLPSLLQLPFLPIMKALGCLTFTGSIISALSGAASLVLLNRLLSSLKFPAAVRWLLIALLQFHPNTWYLFASGMAEPLFLLFVLAVLIGMLSMPYTMRSWVIVGISLAVAFYIRYETLAMIAGVGVAVIVHMWERGKDWRVKTEGWLLAILIPPVYAIAMWVFLNWTLLDDPLYFYRSFYSLSNAPDTAKIVGLAHPLYLAWGNVVEAVKVGVIRSYQQSPAYPVMGIAAFISILWHRNRKGFGLFIVLLSITALTIMQVFLGSLANWTRYWFYAAPFALVMAGIINENLRRKWRIPFYFVLIVLFLAGTPTSLQAMRDPGVGSEEQRFSAIIRNEQQDDVLRASDGYWIGLKDAPIVAAVVDEYSKDGLMLVDASSSVYVILAVKSPQRLYITNDTDYFDVLENPIGKVDYMLVLDSKVEGTKNTINVTYPTLFEHGASWATLVWDSEAQTVYHWRIYQIHAVE
jgi:hypothetical protein